MKKFIFFLVELDGRVRQVVNGVVTSLNNPKPLPNAPDGNQEIAIGWERSEDHGTQVNYSLPLGFVMDGYKILGNDFYKFNRDRILDLVAKRLTYENTTTTFKEYYKFFYKGRLDFSSGVDHKDEKKMVMNIMQGGVFRKMKAKESMDIEIPFDLDAKNVQMDGMYIVGTFRWFLPEYTFLSDGYPGMFQLPNDNPVPGLAIFDVPYTEQSGDPDADTLTYFGQFTQDVADVEVTGLLQNFNNLGSAGPLSVRLIIFNINTNSVRLTIDLTPADPYPENYNLVVNETIDFLAGDRIFLKSASHFSEGNLQINAKSKPVDSVIKGFTVYDLGRKLVEKITGSADNFQSDFLQTQEVILTSFDGVRALPNAAIKTNWRDYKKFVDTQFMTEVTLSDTKVIIEERLQAYKPESLLAPIELGEVKNLKISDAEDKIFTSIKVGNENAETNDTNGKYDFTSVAIWDTPIESVADKQLDLQSPYKASPYEIEQTRANYEGKTTTDKETDNQTVALKVLPEGNDSFNTLATFAADGTPITPGQPLISIVSQAVIIREGMKIKITGSALNSQDITVKSATTWFFGQLIVPNEPLVDEAGVNITIEILEGQYYTLDRTIPVTQLSNPDVAQEVKDTVYNVFFSPKRMLLRHSAWLAGLFYGYETEKLVLSSQQRNKELIAGGITEKTDINIYSLGEPMFLPKYAEFDTIYPADLPELYETEPNRSFAFDRDNVRVVGFNMRTGFALNDLEEQTYKLLLTPDNNLLDLIP